MTRKCHSCEEDLDAKNDNSINENCMLKNCVYLKPFFLSIYVVVVVDSSRQFYTAKEHCVLYCI